MRCGLPATTGAVHLSCGLAALCHRLLLYPAGVVHFLKVHQNSHSQLFWCTFGRCARPAGNNRSLWLSAGKHCSAPADQVESNPVTTAELICPYIHCDFSNKLTFNNSLPFRYHWLLLSQVECIRYHSACDRSQRYTGIIGLCSSALQPLASSTTGSIHNTDALGWRVGNPPCGLADPPS